MSNLFWLLMEGLTIGLLVGLTGAGGGILAVPALMSSQGWAVSQAAPVGLLAITLSAGIGAVEGLFKKIVRYRAAIWIALLGAPMAHVGVLLSHRVSAHWLMLLFGMVMLWVSVRLLLNRGVEPDNPPCRMNHQTGQLIWSAQTMAVLGAIGMTSGLLTGLLGVGGGFVIVPALRRFTNIQIHSIVATSLLVIFLLGGMGMLAQLISGYRFPFIVTSVFVLACMIGMVLGRQLIAKIDSAMVQRLFAIAVLLVGIYMIYQASGSIS